MSGDHVEYPIPAKPKQMALIHNCLAAGQVGLEPINLIKLIRYVWRPGLVLRSSEKCRSIHPCGFRYLFASLLSFVNISLHLFHRTQLQSGWMDLPFDVVSRTSMSPPHPHPHPHPHPGQPPSTGEFICLCEYLFALKPICFIIEFEIEDDIRFPIVWRAVQ